MNSLHFDTLLLMQSPGFSIRSLGAEDASSFREVRLRGLREDPIPFLASYEEDAQLSVADLASRLLSDDPARQVLGAFRAETLIGTLGFYRHGARKARHRASIWGVYVVPEERRKRIGAALLEEAVARLRAVGDVEQVELTVVTSEPAARRMYLRAGFEVHGIVPAAMKVGDQRYDEEMLVKRFAAPHEVRSAGPLRSADRPLLESLAVRSPSECLPWMLELARRHAERRRPADLCAQLGRDGFVIPAAVDLRVGHQLDGLALGASPAFEALQLSPLAPLGCCAAVSPSSQNRIVSTARGSEVVSDPTNVLAIECARRLGHEGAASVRLCTVHQVVRAQRFAVKPGHTQHFKLFALVTAGRALADYAFEVNAMVEQISVCMRVLDAWAARGRSLAKRSAKILMTETSRPQGDRLRRALHAAEPSLSLEEAPLVSSYYDGVRVLFGADTETGEHVNLGDTGLFDWVAKLTSNKRMRLVASGLGLQLLPLRFAPP